MKIHVTEHKSTGALRSISHPVRVFVNFDYHYGYWVDEHELVALLDAPQQATYLAAPGDIELDVSTDIAQRIIDTGNTPYKKSKVA